VKRTSTLAALAVCASAVVGLSALGSPASANPTPATPFRVLVGQGSDTTQDVMNGFADSILASGSDYRETGLLFAATVVGDTSIKTSLIPAVGDSLTIDTGANAETVTVSAITGTATANTLATNTGTGNAVPFNTVTVGALTKAHAANAIVVGKLVPAGTKVMASYDAQGAAFQSKNNANCQYIANNTGTGFYTGTTQNNSVQAGTLANATYLSGGRANGSGNGARAMADAYTATNGIWGCTDFGRASSKRNNVTGLGLNQTVNIPFAIDAVDFAVTTTSNYSRLLTWDQIKAIYRCTFPGMIPAGTVIPAGTSTQAYAAANGFTYATLPQAGSGTSDFLNNALGLTTLGTNTSGDRGAACITDKTPSGGVLEEHDLRTLDDNGIGATSIAQSITQRAQAVAGVGDRQGRTVLVALDNRAASNGGVAHGNAKLNYAVAMTSQFAGSTGNTAGNLQMWRDVFNVVPVNRLADPNFQAAFVGPTSSLCADVNNVIPTYGFAPNPSCGITTNLG